MTDFSPQQTIKMLCEYYNHKLNETQLRIYKGFADTLGHEDFARAAKSHIMQGRNGQFFPKIVDLKAALGHSQVQNEAEQRLIAESQVDLIIRAVETKGRYNMPDFTPEIREAISSAGGWTVLCDTMRDKMNFKRKELADALLRQKTTTGELQARVQGETYQAIARENEKNGQATPYAIEQQGDNGRNL